MEDHSKSVMVALLPTETHWCKIDLPHLTLVYAGEVPDLPPGTFNAIAKDASSLAMLARPVTARCDKIEKFGPDEDPVDVIRMFPNQELFAMRNFLETWNRSEYPFNPHVTIGPYGSFTGEVPFALTFDRIIVSWGVENLTFALRSY